MSLPTLYSFRRCPYAMRARMALDAADISVEHREVVLREKPAEMLIASPKGTVPVLVLPNGDVIDESLDLMIWALGQSDPDNWLVDTNQDRADIEAFLDKFKAQLDQYKYASRYDPSVARGDVNLEKRSEAITTLHQFSDQLEDTAYLRGPAPRLIDIATFPFVRQFAAVEPDWWNAAAHPNLQRWLAGLLASDRFKRIMKKHPIWRPEPPNKH